MSGTSTNAPLSHSGGRYISQLSLVMSEALVPMKKMTVMAVFRTVPILPNKSANRALAEVKMAYELDPIAKHQQSCEQLREQRYQVMMYPIRSVERPDALNKSAHVSAR